MAVIIGYTASLFLAISLLVNGVLRFRIINILGQITFIIYGIMIHANPIIIANSVLFCINVFQISKLLKSKEEFKFIEIDFNNKLVENFIQENDKDLRLFFPEFEYSKTISNVVMFVVLRNGNIANIFVASVDFKGYAKVSINYTVSQYRDYKVGRFIFDKEKTYLLSKGINKVVYPSVYNKSHLDFLKVMGFTQQNIDNKLLWCKDLN